MDRKTDLRLWAVLFWLAAWQIAPWRWRRSIPTVSCCWLSADVLLRLGQLAVTAAFWRTVPGPPSGSSADFCSPRCWRSRWRHWRRGNSGSGG